MKKKIVIFGGGTFNHLHPHLSLAAPAFGTIAKQIFYQCHAQQDKLDVDLRLTKMADSTSSIVTNADLEREVVKVIEDPLTKIVFFTAAVCDFTANTYEGFTTTPVWSGTRLNSRHQYQLVLSPADKIVQMIRKERKDIFLVACKTTTGARPENVYRSGLNLCKSASVNLVLANDIVTKLNMIITPEEAAYHKTTDRAEIARNLVEMALLRSHLTFTRSTVVNGKAVPWDDPRVPVNLREVVNFCVKGDAYKPFKGATVGHFATKLSDTEFLTSIRRSDFNRLGEIGLVYVKTDGPDTVLAYGAKPSVGGQSQRIVFTDHPGYDCIVHFHSPLREDHAHDIPVVSQREVECGSHQCGKNTSDNLKEFALDQNRTHALKAVMLRHHGPNIVFNKDVPAELVIDFIKRNFDLSKKTGGYNLK